MKDFKLKPGIEFIPLCDLLKAADLCESGGEAKHVIAEGKVLVDGAVETRKRCKVKPGQVVEYKGAKLVVSS